MRDDYGQLNEDFEDRRDVLGEFFELENQTLASDEAQALNPIYEGLKSLPEHYSDAELISSGGEKEIYKVRDLRTDRIVAMAKPLACDTPAQKEAFLREARLTACLQHPNIVTIYDQGLDEGSIPYFTMEFIRGQNLRRIIAQLADGDEEAKAGYPRERLLEIFMKVCDAVSYAHSRGVAHLDIKPANIQVGPFGEVQLCDWGVSKVLSKGFDEELDAGPLGDDRPNSDLLNDLMPVDVVQGTPGFIAPEQAGSGKVVSELTDVYALGAVLYCLLVGRPPVHGSSQQEILGKTRAGNVERISVGRMIPKGLVAVAMKALSLDPADRYASVKALREELERFMAGFATHAQHAGLLQRASLLLKRRPIVFRVIAISISVLLLVLGVSFLRVVRAKEEAEENLRLYVEASNRSDMFADNLQKAASGFYQYENFMEARAKSQLLKLQLEESINAERNRQIAHKLAMLYFVRQQFGEANAYFRQSGSKLEDDRFFSLSEEYALRKEDGALWLDVEVLRELMIKAPVLHDNVFHALGHYYLQTKFKAALDPEETLPLVETLLDRLNHQGPHSEGKRTLFLERRDSGWHLSLKGKPYAVLNLPVTTARTESNVLNPLGLYSLDISHSRISDPMQLEGSGIKELEMRGVEWIRPQVRMLNRLHLRKLIHSLDISDEFMEEVLPDVELIRVDSEMD